MNRYSYKNSFAWKLLIKIDVITARMLMGKRDFFIMLKYKGCCIEIYISSRGKESE